MKTIFSLFIVGLTMVLMLTQCDKDVAPVIIDIPDINFLKELIEDGIDTDGDGLISESEAELVTSLEVRGWLDGNEISDMTGLESFVNLEFLDCSNNKLISLDVTYNIDLKFLYCQGNRLKNLDISNNISLIELDCGGTFCCGCNELTNLDLSNCIELKYLNCSRNKLNNLDVSNCTSLMVLSICYNNITGIDLVKNTSLVELNCGSNEIASLNVTNLTDLSRLYCYNNQLSSLDISNNSKLEYLYISEMPTLTEICVWTMLFPPEGVEVLKYGSPNVYFTTDCSK